MTPAQMKKDFIRKLNILQACGINAIIFQVRPEADAFYKSDIEPWSRFFTGEQGLAPEGNFDPMAFFGPVRQVIPVLRLPISITVIPSGL